jgi:hypothetical protein
VRNSPVIGLEHVRTVIIPCTFGRTRRRRRQSCDASWPPETARSSSMPGESVFGHEHRRLAGASRARRPLARIELLQQRLALMMPATSSRGRRGRIRVARSA